MLDSVDGVNRADMNDSGLSEAEARGIGRRPDPGSPRARAMAWLLLIPLLAGVLVLQHFRPPPEPPESLVTPPGPVEPFTVMAKVEVKLWHASTQTGKSEPTLPAALMENLDGSATSPLDRIRAAVVAAEMVGPAEARTRLSKVEDELNQIQPKAGPLDPGFSEADIGLMRESVRKLETLYQGGGETSISEEDQRFLVDHHGWFGRLAIVHARPASDPVKAQMLGGGVAIVLLLVAACLIGFVSVLTGLVLLIVAVTKLASGTLPARFDRPAPGGSVYLETVAVFLAAFLLLQPLKWGLSVLFGGAAWLDPLSLALQWLVLPAIAWPVVRGVSWARLRADMGWHAERGVWREIGAGFVGYLAGLPVFLLGVIISFTAIIIREALRSQGGGSPGEPPSNPIVDVVGAGSPVVLVMLYALASVWAPIVEEAVFRGAFYRHLRARLPVVIAAAFSGVVFAAMHGYDVVMLGPVFALGFNFALLREWRGSLIAPMTAHAIHNGVLLAFVITLINLLGT